MKVLIYGAGVLGSYLSHELCKGNHSVTMLARDQRYKDLSKHGLVIQHVKQNIKTIDSVRVVNCIKSDDCYDIVFVVVQNSQLDDVLKVLLQNTYSSTIVFIGNNCEPEKTYNLFTQKSLVSHKILFGFIDCAGNRKGEVVYNWHKNNCIVTIGSYNKNDTYIKNIESIFLNTSLILSWKDNINAWLKCHCALITPIALAIQYEHGATYKIRKSVALKLAIESIKQSLQMFNSMGYYDELQEAKPLKWRTNILRWILAIFLSTKSGHLMAVNHSLSAISEIDLLTNQLLSYSKLYNYPLPALNELYTMVKESRV